WPMRQRSRESWQGALPLPCGTSSTPSTRVSRCRSPRAPSTRQRFSAWSPRPKTCAKVRRLFSTSASRRSRANRSGRTGAAGTVGRDRTAGAKKMTTIQGTGRAEGFRFALVVSTYHDLITSRLEAAALSALSAAGAVSENIVVIRVPGAFEIPIAAQHAGESGRYDAVICLGCLIKGETPHFEY